MHDDQDYPKVADYFVVAGLTDTSCPLDEELAFPDSNHKLNPQPKDPITDICIIDRTLEEKCPQGYTCIDKTPSGFLADLNHGSFTAHNIFLCYRRGRDRPPLVDLGVYYEGLDTVKNGISVVETTPTGRNANVNNKSGIGSFPIYLTYRRAEESAPQSTLVLTDICIILTNKNEYPPYAYCLVDKNLNKGMIGSSVYLCYKKSMRQVNSVAFKAGFLGRYPADDSGGFPLPATVPLFCLPMGATIECWSSKTKHPLPSFSSFVLTTESSEKVYGAVVSFYESYPEDLLKEDHKFKLGLLRGDGHKATGRKTIHTNKAICLLSRWPLFDAFRDFLIYLYRLTVSPIAHPVPVERHIAHFMQNVPFPSPQRPRVQYQMSPMHATILTRPQMTPIPLSGASFLALIDDLGAENTLTLITLALTEHKIVIHSLRRAEITRVAEALITLLFPFKWQCTYVPLCPLEMAYVLEAPCPFIVGVDSRYFDLYEPPKDVACVNLDTNNITLLGDRKTTWKMLPKKPAKQTRTILQNLFTEIKQSCPRMRDDEGEYMSTVFDPELTRTRRHMQIEIIIQESILKFMAIMMHGYRQYLLPITEAPGASTTDPSSLFSIQEFIRSRDRSSQRFFNAFTGTQLFAAFIEERSFASFSGGLGGEGAGKAASLVFFDDCIDRLESEHPDHVRLIEADDTLKSEHTVFIMPPDEKGLPSDVGYQYTTFPELQEELFALENDEGASEGVETPIIGDKQRRKSGTFVIGRRTKQETKITQKQAKLYSADAQMWSRLLLSSTYSIWFGCLSEFTRQCRSKAAALRAGHGALQALKDKGCIPLPDETCYRVLMHLCYSYNKPVLAVRVFHFVRDSGTQLSAITYGLYNKAVLESTWPSSNRDGYMLWQKLRHILQATIRLRQAIRHFNNNSAVAMSDNSSDIDSLSRNSLENAAQPIPTQKRLTPTGEQSLNGAPASLEPVNEAERNPSSAGDTISAGGQSDHGYNSMPKNLVQRGSPPGNAAETHDDQTETKSTETTDSVFSSISEEAADYPPNKAPLLERTLSGRIIQPPTTLPLSGVHAPCDTGEMVYDSLPATTVDQGLQSDDTVVSFVTESGKSTTMNNIRMGSPTADPAFHSSSPKSSVSSRDRSSSIVKTPVSPAPASPLSSPMLERLEDSVFDIKNSEVEQDEASKSNSSQRLSSPGTPEMLAFFGDDSKFLSGLSDSDKRRHQELCGKRPSSNDQEIRPRSASALLPLHSQSVGGGISPLVGQKSFKEFSHGLSSMQSAETPTSRKNFDNLTADDIAASPLSHRSIFSSGGSITSRSRSGSRLSTKKQATTQLGMSANNRSPTHSSFPPFVASATLPNLQDAAMLTSTPMRPVLPEEQADNDPSEDKKNSELDPLTGFLENEETNEAKPKSKKQNIERHDITNLALDPLSPLSTEMTSWGPFNGGGDGTSSNSKDIEADGKDKRHLVDEIQQYMNRDSLDRSQSVIDVDLSASQRNGHSGLRRQSSAPGQSPETPRKHPPPGLLSRSLTFAQGSSISNSLMSSGSKLNSLLKATTIGMASKAKKLASTLAKDINETVQTNLAYYTPEKFKGSLSELAEDHVSSSQSQLNGSVNDLYSSQSSLRSADSIHSSVDVTGIGDVRKRGGTKQNKHTGQRPLSMPPFGSQTSEARTSLLGVPGNNSNASDLHLTTSMNSLNTKGTCDMDVTISSCSKCHLCSCLVYDEEIMAGWMADESNLNTHCPFCNSLFVPFLNIELKDYRVKIKSPNITSPPVSDNTEQTSTFSQSFDLPLTPADDSLPHISKDISPEVASEPSNPTPEVEGHEDNDNHSNVLITPPSTPAMKSDPEVMPVSEENTGNAQNPDSKSTAEADQQPSTSKKKSSSQSDSNATGPNDEPYSVLEPVTVPYLSPLVLRKELESLLENEGTRVLGEAEFVDQHPIIYWNLVWYFRRLNLHSNLFNLVLTSKLVESRSSLSSEGAAGGHKAGRVAIHVMWDNLKLHENMAKPALYWAYHQLMTQGPNGVYQAYSQSFLENIKQSIITDDVRGPLVALLNEFSAHSYGQFSRRSAYREILYLVIVALGKESIDVDAFDRVYREAYDALTVQELSLTKKCDKPPNTHAKECRNMFGELDLY